MTTEAVERPPQTADRGTTEERERCRRQWVEGIITSIHDDAGQVKRHELAQAVSRLESCGDLTDSQREALEAMADAIVGQLLAVPTEQLRRAHDWSSIAVALRLFDAESTADRRLRTEGPPAGGNR